MPVSTLNISDRPNPTDRFETMIVGPSNKLAHSAALAITSATDHHFNPLFIYGGAAVGKTHLIHAIANRSLENGIKPNALLLLDAVGFSRALMVALETDRMDELRKRIRRCQSLLIDDIHQLVDRREAQEELLHTLDDLLGQDRPIVFTSRISPQDLHAMPDGLTSRFVAGLPVHIHPPGYEERVQITQQWLQEFDPPPTTELDAVELLASKQCLDLNEMKQVLRRAVLAAQHGTDKVSVALIAEELDAELDATAQRLTLPQIVRCVARRYGVTLAALRSHKRLRQITEPRQICMYLARKLLQVSYHDIGYYFGGRDHTTVMYACRKIEHQLAGDPRVFSTIQELRHALKSNQ